MVRDSLRAFLLALLLFVVAPPVNSAEKLQIGTNVWPGYEPLYYARDQGLLPTSKFTIKEYETSHDVQRAFKNGSLDVAFLTLDEALSLVDLGVGAKIFLALDFSNGADAVILQPALKDLKGLKGKTVGLEMNGVGAFLFNRMLDVNGFSRNDFKTINIDAGEHLRSFKAKEVDAIVTFEPTRSKLIELGGKVIFDSSQIPEEIIDVAVVRTDQIKKKRVLIRELVQAWFAIVINIQANPKDAFEFMAGREKVSAAHFKDQFSRLKLLGREENLSLIYAKPQRLLSRIVRISRHMVKEKLISEGVEGSDLLYQDSLVGKAND